MAGHAKHTALPCLSEGSNTQPDALVLTGAGYAKMHTAWPVSAELLSLFVNLLFGVGCPTQFLFHAAPGPTLCCI